MPRSVSPPPKRRRLDFNTYATLQIGPEKKPVAVFRDVLDRHCAYFRIKSEDKDRAHCELSSLDCDAFAIFLQWIYTAELVLMEEDEERQDLHGIRKWTLLAKLYTIGTVLYAPVLKNKIVDMFLQGFRGGPKFSMSDTKLIDIIYEFSPEGSQLRHILTDHYMIKLGGGYWLKHNRDILPREFLADLAVGWSVMGMDPRKLLDPAKARQCVYHDHDEGVPDCK
ncbi:unnamed protein product [Zymoseptoria tritici ST99CH_1A5]|uniref:BTB domain-containing protein n=2 Tax=Zymoseptoria tritici TaxID=1047171 RepID=A0A2H1GU74_ZYMTR|nr:unnamed protein product [Zymoseptoria tritici ST99CH_1E4]SMY27179.1 unnamed protein product [Zymoseptoria tritici ST99CH_1A5]